MSIFAMPSALGLMANVVAAWALLLLVNIPAAILNLRFDEDEPNVVLSPPGWLVVAVWLILFPAMGAARWLLLRSPNPEAAAVAQSIVLLALLCASYIYYTILPANLTGISAAVFGLIGNVVVIAFSAFVAFRANAHSGLAAALVACVAIWTAFATISVAQLVVRAE